MPSLRQAYIVKKFGNDDNSIMRVCNILMNSVVFKGVDECFFGDYPTISEMNAAYHKRMAIVILMSQLSSLSEYCGCKNKLDNAQLEQCAEIIGLTYPYLKISELALFFARFKAAKYGHFYGAVDPLVITSALRTFIRERNDAYFEINALIQEQKNEESKKKAISWEEYCQRNGIKGRKSPLSIYVR